MATEYTQKEIHECPFCESTNVMIVGGGFLWSGNLKVKCHGCKATGSEAPTREMAIRLWNNAVRNRNDLIDLTAFWMREDPDPDKIKIRLRRIWDCGYEAGKRREKKDIIKVISDEHRS